VHRRHIPGYGFSILVMAALLITVFSANSAFAQSASQQSGSSKITLHATKGATHASSGSTVNVFKLPKETASSAAAKSSATHPFIPVRTSPHLAAAKAAAAHETNAPKARALTSPPTGAGSNSSSVGFNGMADSATICPYFGGCQPPDMALATSPQFVLQGVNTSYAVYNTSGKLVLGPINDQVWYGVPNPPNNCDPAGPFLSDPRAFYDPNTGLFWTATLQVEAAAFGVGVNCPTLSKYWVANINLKTGVMHVYSFDMTLGGTVNAGADYTQFGFSGKTIAFTGNMFDFTTGNYDFAEAQFADKATMAAGKPVTPVAFTGLSATTVTGGTDFLDTIQPVETETTPANDPGVQYLVNSFNMNGDPFGNNCLSSVCEGFVTWAYDPANQTLGGTLVFNTLGPNPTYIVPNNADEPGGTQVIETIDTRITGTPVYSVGGGAGLISFSLDTSVSNGGIFNNVVPGILWGQIQVAHFSSSPIAGLFQSGYLAFPGDQAASFGAMMQDKNGRLVMVFDTMSGTLNPSIMVVSRKASDPLGTIGNAKFIVKGPSPTFDTRWGDFEAASYDGFSTNHIWVSSQYSISGDWATFIARV